jgi:hypothetical protein
MPIEELMEMVFSIWSMPKLYKGASVRVERQRVVRWYRADNDVSTKEEDFIGSRYLATTSEDVADFGFAGVKC